MYGGDPNAKLIFISKCFSVTVSTSLVFLALTVMWYNIPMC